MNIFKSETKLDKSDILKILKQVLLCLISIILVSFILGLLLNFLSNLFLDVNKLTFVDIININMGNIFNFNNLSIKAPLTLMIIIPYLAFSIFYKEYYKGKVLIKNYGINIILFSIIILLVYSLTQLILVKEFNLLDTVIYFITTLSFCICMHLLASDFDNGLIEFIDLENKYVQPINALLYGYSRILVISFKFVIIMLVSIFSMSGLFIVFFRSINNDLLLLLFFLAINFMCLLPNIIINFSNYLFMGTNSLIISDKIAVKHSIFIDMGNLFANGYKGIVLGLFLLLVLLGSLSIIYVMIKKLNNENYKFKLITLSILFGVTNLIFACIGRTYIETLKPYLLIKASFINLYSFFIPAIVIIILGLLLKKFEGSKFDLILNNLLILKKNKIVFIVYYIITIVVCMVGMYIVFIKGMDTYNNIKVMEYIRMLLSIIR